MLRITILFACWLYCSADALSQQGDDSVFVARAIGNTVARHHAALAAEARLYNGILYRFPPQNFEQHPYLFSEDWIEGSARYDGELFTNIPLMYDAFHGVLVAEHYPSGNAIQLITQKLDMFTLGKRRFEKISSDGTSLPRTTFYEVLYDGNSKVVALRQKSQRKKLEARGIEFFYDERNRYFLLRDGVYHSIKSRKSVLDILADRKPDLKKLSRTRRLVFSQDRELMFRSLAAYYDTLK